MTETKTFAQHIADLKATRDAKSAEMRAIAQKAMDEQRNMDGGESEHFEVLRAEIKSIDADIKRFSELQALDAATAKPVEDIQEREKTYTPPGVPVSVRNTQKLEPGIAFARAAKCIALGAMAQRDPVQVAKSLYNDREDIVGAVNNMVTKAVVPAASTSNPQWAGNLVQNSAETIFLDFLEFLRPKTIIGQFGQNGIPAYRRVPFRTPIVAQETAAQAYWTGEGKAKGLTKFDFGTKTLEPLKVATIAVATMEVLRDSSLDVDYIIRDSISDAIRARLDEDFLNPRKEAVPGVSPASIMNLAQSSEITGANPEDFREAITSLFTVLGGRAAKDCVIIMPTGVAMTLASWRTMGQQEFPDMTLNGGHIMGVPVITTDYANVKQDDGRISGLVGMVKASDILVADAGDIDVSISREATLQMTDTPVDNLNAAPSVVNLWQNNMVGFRAERTINWTLATPYKSAAYFYFAG